MSIANVVLDEGGATVAVDTMAEIEGNIHTSMKMLPLPHARSIVLGRGTLVLLRGIFLGCFIGAEDYDSLLVGVAEGLAESAGSLHTIFKSQVGPERAREAGKNELTVVGWSRAAGRMKCRNYWQKNAGGEFQEREVPHAFCGPGDSDDGAWGKSLRVGDEARMIAVARSQMQYVRERGISGHGGQLVIAHIDRDSIRSHIAATL